MILETERTAGALIAGGVVALRRETRGEFPAPPASPAWASAPKKEEL